jgi:putative two-component system response regulator
VQLRIKNQLEFKHQRDHLQELVEEKTVDLRNTLKVMLTSLGALAEYRDPETGAHIKRTQVLVQMLAEKLQNHPRFKDAIPNKEYIDYYATAAPLHDIGKVGIPDEILRKPARLNEEEWAVMSTHAQMGYDVLVNATHELKDHPLVRISAEIILNHHERYDGHGYPNGVKGDDIPVGARLMSVADVYDALVSRRPYKEAYPHEVAVNEIFEGKGTQFDPDVVDAFMALESQFPEIYERFKEES